MSTKAKARSKPAPKRRPQVTTGPVPVLSDETRERLQALGKKLKLNGDFCP